MFRTSIGILCFFSILESSSAIPTTPDAIKEFLAKADEKVKMIHQGIRYATDEATLNHFKNEEKEFRKWVYHNTSKVGWSHLTDEKLIRYLEIYAIESTHIVPEYMQKRFDRILIRANNMSKDAFNSFHRKLSDEFLMKYQGMSKREMKKRDKNIQKYWSDCSHSLATTLLPLINQYFDLIAETAKTIDGNLYGYIFWKYTMGFGYDNYPLHMNTIWTNQLKYTAEKFLSFMVMELVDQLALSQSYKHESAPAYLFGIISTPQWYSQVFSQENLDTFVSKKLNDLNANFNITNLVKSADQFFSSLNFPSLDNHFWERSKFSVANNNEESYMTDIFIDEQNYRLEVHAPVTLETSMAIYRHLFKIHKSLLIEKSDLEWIFRESDFRPFSDALEAAIAMAAKTPSRLVRDGLVTREELNDDLVMESLKIEAVNVFTKLAAAQTMDLWSWHIIYKMISLNNEIKELWNFRLKEEGVVPVSISVPPTNNGFFLDCSSPEHSFPSYINYLNFTSIILQYQIFGSFCETAGQYNPDDPVLYPLHKCDLSGSSVVGNILTQNIIPLGASKHWKTLLKMLTGIGKVNAQPLIDYFRPILIKLEKGQGSSSYGWKDRIKDFVFN